MSIQLVLSHYLAGLRERGELDALLPELLKAMGHAVLSRPQIGVSQAGVDVVSVAKREDGETEVFLFVVKFGDVGRSDLYADKQSVAPSVREASSDFVRNRLPKALRSLHKTIVLLSNGVVKQEAQSGFAALSEEIGEVPGCSLDFWGTDHLTPLIERHLFDETLLLSKGKSDLRAALAGLEESDTSVHRFVRFLDTCFDVVETEKDRKGRALKKTFLKRCAVAAMGWAVLLVWGRSEDNLKPGVVSGEYLLLRMWSEAVKVGLWADKNVTARLEALLMLQAEALLEYFDKTMPQLQSRRAILQYRPDRLAYTDLVFDELGRLSVLLLMLQKIPGSDELRQFICGQLLRLTNEHGGCRLPLYDGHTIDLSLIFAALMGESDSNNAKRLLGDVTQRLYLALQTDRYLPVDTDLFEDAVALNITGEADSRDFFQTSSLVPALATLAALLGDEDVLKQLREDVGPLLKGATLERWFPALALETLSTSRKWDYGFGVSRAITGPRATVQDEKDASLNPPEGAADPTQFKWYGTPWIILAAMSARTHRHPVPTWFFAEYAQLV